MLYAIYANVRSDLRVDTALVLRGVGNLGPFSPDDLSVGGDHTQLGDVDLDDCSLGQDTELSVQRVLGVLLDGQNGQLHGNSHFGAVQSAGQSQKRSREKDKHTG